ncbi:MAG: SDR family NAD(P)-dependent oxidoreductase [Ancalomicrobiaceae bacterium]|nr:SDR family NAD(P)-dependent oxidoreductase [Ancalomicrobiaceae bacterium]
MHPDTERSVALVTGSTSGIGVAIARRLVREGYAVVLHSRNSADAGNILASELGHAAYVQADLALEDDRARLVQKAADLWGRLDVLVNNAGISSVIPHADLGAATSGIWHELYEVNVIAPFRLVAEAEPFLRTAARRGRSADHRCIIRPQSGDDQTASGAQRYRDRGSPAARRFGRPSAREGCEVGEDASLNHNHVRLAWINRGNEDMGR